MDDRVRAEAVQLLEPLGNLPEPAHSQPPAKLWLGVAVAQKGAERAAVGQLEDEGQAVARVLEDAHELDEMRVLEPVLKRPKST